METRIDRLVVEFYECNSSGVITGDFPIQRYETPIIPQIDSYIHTLGGGFKVLRVGYSYGSRKAIVSMVRMDAN